MQHRILWVVAPLVIAVLATAAVAFGPAVLNIRLPSATGDTTGTNPPPSEPTAPSPPPPETSPPPSPAPEPAKEIGVPAWHVGDTWTYNVSLAHTWDDTSFHGQLTKSVAAILTTEDWGSAYNVTVSGSFEFTGMTESMESAVVELSDASVGGYAWYRTADLAKILEVRTLHMAGTVTALNRTIEVSYTSRIETSFDPPLAVWAFPLAENATWNVTSNATVHYWSSYHVQGLDDSFGADHYANVTQPVRFLMRTGAFEDVTTPAGTFNALPAKAYLAPHVFVLPERVAGVVLNATEEPILFAAHPFAEAWYSEAVGNVVKAENWDADGGARLEMVLVSYAKG